MVAPSPDTAIRRFREKTDRELRTGVVGLVLLLAVDRTGPDYGYRILRNVAAWSQGGLALKEGTAYPILQNLERAGLLTSTWGEGEGGPRRKYYQTTNAGRAALAAALDDWRALTASVDTVLRAVTDQEARP